MNNFDKIIGYEPIKTELLRICDMIKNRDIYEKRCAAVYVGDRGRVQSKVRPLQGSVSEAF